MYPQLKLGNQVCFRIYTLQRLLTQAYRPLLTPLGLTYPQYLVMMVLWENGKQLVGDLVRKLMLDTNTLTPLLQRMERAGFIERTHDTADGRQTLVSLTRKGVALQEKAKDVPACLTERMRGMSMSENDLTAFAATLDTLITQLKQ